MPHPATERLGRPLSSIRSGSFANQRFYPISLNISQLPERATLRPAVTKDGHDLPCTSSPQGAKPGVTTRISGSPARLARLACSERNFQRGRLRTYARLRRYFFRSLHLSETGGRATFPQWKIAFQQPQRPQRRLMSGRDYFDDMLWCPRAGQTGRPRYVPTPPAVYAPPGADASSPLLSVRLPGFLLILCSFQIYYLVGVGSLA